MIIDIKALRGRLGMTQQEFARIYHLDYASLVQWEQQRRHPSGAATVLLQLIERDPDTIAGLLKNAG